MKLKAQKGFTLIEILIVVAIIGMLASIVLVGLGSFRARGRDARRVADLRGVQNALELYYSAKGSYPIGDNMDWTGGSGLTSILTGVGIGVSKLPDDPLGGSVHYFYGSNGQKYILGATLEEKNSTLLSDPTQPDPDFGVLCSPPNGIYCVAF